VPPGGGTYYRHTSQPVGLRDAQPRTPWGCNAPSPDCPTPEGAEKRGGFDPPEGKRPKKAAVLTGATRCRRTTMQPPCSGYGGKRSNFETGG